MTLNNDVNKYYVVSLQIHDDMSSLVVAQLLFLQSESSKKPVHMYINSPGEVFIKHDTLQCSSNFSVKFIE